ncbi:hypothetical protein EMPS_04213 [Entomortierella parvispora]|uniref:Uncharacterized protein n=1 Tax=Entomortierella parvispora TaxID=205924 RepID=A0A9P3H827_9FUNG|nr:hypothetical protein EMPS_04213 [Entomortierella parvispora]
MSALIKNLTFKGLRHKEVRYPCADLELLSHVLSKWDILEGGSLQDGSTGTDYCVALEISEKRSIPDRLTFGDAATNFDKTAVLFRHLGSPMCLYRLSYNFPAAVKIQRSDKSIWGAALIHKDTGKFLGFEDIKGRLALVSRQGEVYLRYYQPKSGGGQKRVEQALAKSDWTDSETPYLEILPSKLAAHLSDPVAGDPVLLEELTKFVEDNSAFKQDMMTLLSYLASDQCAHRYENRVAGHED